jgi:hypothetical protein
VVVSGNLSKVTLLVLPLTNALAYYDEGAITREKVLWNGPQDSDADHHGQNG